MNSRGGSSTKYQVLESSSLKCCIVGDTKSGKTAIAYRLQAQEFKEGYSATSFDNYSGKNCSLLRLLVNDLIRFPFFFKQHVDINVYFRNTPI